MSIHCPEQLDKAIQNRLRAKLCASIDDARHELAMRFAHPAADAAGGEEGFWVELAEHRPVIDRLVSTSMNVEVSFNLDDAKVFFDSTIVRKRRHYWLKKLLLLRFPDRLSVVEQRGTTRTFIPDDVNVYARLFRATGPGADQPLVSWRLFDLSAGGAGIICPPDRRLLELVRGQPLHVIISLGSNGIPLSATHRYTQVLSANSVRVGVQFDHAQPKAVRDEFKHLIERLNEMRTQRHIIGTLATVPWTG